MWVEFGKLAYYTYHEKFSCPSAYFFVAPQGAGNRLLRLMKNPADLRAGVIENWDRHCRDKITSVPVPLDGKLGEHLDSLDFSIFSAVPPLRIIDAHAKTRWYVARFGGGLPPRPPAPVPPTVPTQEELNYVTALLHAYSDYLKVDVSEPADLKARPSLSGHFEDSRLEFYSAEALRSFSRDTLPDEDEYDRLTEEVHDGIRDEIRAEHPDGYSRVRSAVKAARGLQITDHPLVGKLTVRDRGGICHQLANDLKVKWVEPPS